MSIKTQLLVVISLFMICSAINDYQIIKRRVDRPIPNLLQYFLTDYTGREISPWSDIDINFDSDSVNGVIEIPK